MNVCFLFSKKFIGSSVAKFVSKKEKVAGCSENLKLAIFLVNYYLKIYA